MLVVTMISVVGLAIVAVPYLIIRFFLAAVGAVRYKFREDWIRIRKEALFGFANWVLLLFAVPIATDATRLFISDTRIIPSVVLDRE
jgi:hypothetical protein